jgi:hypothetical protein
MIANRVDGERFLGILLFGTSVATESARPADGELAEARWQTETQ